MCFKIRKLLKGHGNCHIARLYVYRKVKSILWYEKSMYVFLQSRTNFFQTWEMKSSRVLVDLDKV